MCLFIYFYHLQAHENQIALEVLFLGNDAFKKIISFS